MSNTVKANLLAFLTVLIWGGPVFPLPEPLEMKFHPILWFSFGV